MCGDKTQTTAHCCPVEALWGFENQTLWCNRHAVGLKIFGYLKGSYDDAKKNIILCIWWNAMCLCGLRFKKRFSFSHTVHYCCSSLPRLSGTSTFLQSSLFWKKQCALIGQLSSALRLAEYVKCVTEMLRPLPYLETHRVSTTWRWQQQYSENSLSVTPSFFA